MLYKAYGAKYINHIAVQWSKGQCTPDLNETMYCVGAQNLMAQFTCKLNIDVAIVSKLYRNLEDNNWERNLSK